MTLSPGEMIGPYRVENLLGHGGMGSVYRAFHARLNRFVALKTLHASSEPSFTVRFEREAQIVAALDHPNIVPVYDFAEASDQPYLVMKLIEGTTLRFVMAEGALTFEEVLTIVEPIARALDYAHSQNVLHRDIKPSNILLDKQGTPYLTDFGLARLSLQPESTISEGMMLGTPHYISPEQVKGVPLDHRADLYSFGVVLYEMLVGKVPFNDGTPYTIIQDHVNRDLPRPSTINPAITPRIESVLMRAMAKRPEDRYSTAQTMVTALRDSLITTSGVNSKRERNSTPTRPRKRRRWRRVLLIIAAFVLVVIVLNVLSDIRDARIAASVTPIPRLTVADSELTTAQTAVARIPADALAYLALARAQFLQERDIAANTAIEQGLAYAADRPAYLLTAGDLAIELERGANAIGYYLRALTEAQNTEAYPAVRADAGSHLYQLATTVQSLTVVQVRQLTQEIIREQTTVGAAVLALALINSGNLRVAETTLARALTDDPGLAEAHLVLGELYLKENDRERALASWSRARDASDAPLWVLERIESLSVSLTPTATS